METTYFPEKDGRQPEPKMYNFLELLRNSSTAPGLFCHLC